MTEFADRFSEKLEQNEFQISKDLESGLDEKVRGLLEDRFDEIFQEETFSKKQDGFNVIASDAGRNDIEFKNNTRFYIVQAAAVDKTGSITRKMDTGTLRPYKQGDYEKFLQKTSEIVELNSMIEALEGKEFREPTYVLIDGTLLTRLLVVPEELKLSRQQDKSLELIERFQELLEIAEENENLVLAGISKDSNSGILYSKLLGEIIEEKIEELDVSGLEEVDEEDKQFLEKNYYKIRFAPEEAEKALKNLREGGADKGKIDEIEELMERYRVRFSDTGFLEEMGAGVGFTTPLEVGEIKTSFFNALDDFEEDGENFVENRFSNTLKDEEKDTYVEKIGGLVEDLRDSPGVLSFYWKPSETDQALRVDLLSHDINGSRLRDFGKQEFVEPGEKIQDILALLKTGYAGEGMHNVWISQADNSASLTNKQVEKVYKPLLSKKLGVNLRNYLRRRDKRV